MARYRVQDIKQEMVYGVMSEVKYVQTYTIDQLLIWLRDLTADGYEVVWCKKHRMILEHKLRYADYVFIDVKAKIDPKDNKIMAYFQPIILLF